MKWSKSFYLGLLSLSLIAGAGCNWLKPDDAPGDGMVPPPLADPGAEGARGAQFDPSGPGGFTDGSGLPASGNEWTTIPGLKFQPVYFAYDQSTVGTSEQGKLDQVASYMKQNAVVGVLVEGNCDERGSEEYNRGLGERRALAVKDYLIKQGIPDARIKTISYGKERPADLGHNEAAWAKNRRAELVGQKMR
ncbi:MAG: peptidoglycan-associated lipoprotein [Lentisphaerae bacterium GWF2_52_8]|nr:MAG: peptidoglycan-associated lipoprotein [Lentisphaerae bacterium GWF2_52_8]